MGFKIKKTVNGETVWEPIKAKKYTASKTIEYTGTLPITITADGSALLDYKIYGNTVQAGTPTPENPIMPEGVGERTGNILNPESRSTNQQGAERWGGVFPAGTYYVFNNSVDYIYYRDGVSSTTSTAITPTMGAVITTTNELVVWHSSKTKDIMVAVSSTPLPYIPYGYKLPILSNSTVTNIYLGEVKTTRRIKKLVLTGEENILLRAEFANATAYSYAHYTADALPYNAAPIICSHFPFLASYADQSDHIYQDTKNFYITSTQYRTVADFKSYLAAQYAAGTPVTIWYVLVESETAVVNEPLMKIGDYADTLSMEQAGVSIPTLAGSTVIDYDGAPKPSQMYIKYNSWSGWEDIDNYKMVNGNWTQEVT